VPTHVDGEWRTVWRTVVGVVADARYRGLDDVRFDYYEPSAQANHPVKHVMIRTKGEALRIIPDVYAHARAFDAQVVLGGVTTMETIFERAMAPWRFTVWAFSLLGIVAFVLAAGGLFSLVALSVASRTKEFAVRVALGATRWQVTGHVMAHAARLATVGIVLGTAGAVATTRLLGSLLFEVEPLDPVTFAGVLSLVAFVVTAATYVPASAASRVDPITALKRD
jgi:hypothetical protein